MMSGWPLELGQGIWAGLNVDTQPGEREGFQSEDSPA